MDHADTLSNFIPLEAGAWVLEMGCEGHECCGGEGWGAELESWFSQ